MSSLDYSLGSLDCIHRGIFLSFKIEATKSVEQASYPNKLHWGKCRYFLKAWKRLPQKNFSARVFSNFLEIT